MDCIIKGKADNWFASMPAEDFDGIAWILIDICGLDKTEKIKIIQRLSILYNLGFIEDNSLSIDEYGDISWVSVTIF